MKRSDVPPSAEEGAEQSVTVHTWVSTTAGFWLTVLVVSLVSLLAVKLYCEPIEYGVEMWFIDGKPEGKWLANVHALLPPEDRHAQRPGLVMAAIYRALLDEIARDRFQVLKQRTALTPVRKLWIAWRTWVTA